MKEDPRQILNDQLLASELQRKENQIASIKQLPFGLGFYTIASLMMITIVVGLSREPFDLQMTLLFLVSSLLLLLIILSNIRINQKLTTLIDLIGEEKLRRLTYKSSGRLESELDDSEEEDY